MVDFALRFDMRQPEFCTAGKRELYSAAVEQCAWGENNGFSQVHLSEHHGTEDNYCPSPLILASAVAARTERIMIMISALIAPLHNPIKLAEDLSVLDIISGGRVIPILSAGYRQTEFEMLGSDLGQRKAYMEAIITTLTQAWSGQEFQYHGKNIRVTPTPHSEPRPMLFMGGSSGAAARRAARYADYFIPSRLEFFDVYRDELQQLDKPDPGPMPKTATSVFFVADDADAYWQKIAPHLLHESNSYARWAEEADVPSPYAHHTSIDELRDSPQYRMYTPQSLVDFCIQNPDLTLLTHPLCGGIHPELAWQNLETFADKVLPALREEGLV